MDTEPPDNQDQIEQPPTKKRPGRPRKWPEGRRIPLVKEGRMSFQPGDKHPMDAQTDLARDLREAIKAELAELQGLMLKLAELDDTSEAISREEQAVTALLWEMYGTRKHRDHIVATFVAARRRRLLQRLQAARAALEQARQFLSADMDILPRLQQAIAEAEASELALHGPPPPMPERPATTDEAESTEREQEAQGVSLPEGDTQEEADEAPVVLDQEDPHKELLRTVGGGDDAKATRAQLHDFEARVHLMRNAITDGRGWFEWYYVKRPKRYTPEAAAYLRREEPVPEDVQMYEEDDRTPWGPYLRFCMYEGGIQYRIGMGHIRGRKECHPSDPPKL